MSDLENDDVEHDARGRDESDDGNNNDFIDDDGGSSEEEDEEDEEEEEEAPPNREVTLYGVFYGMSNEVTDIQVREGVTNIPDETFIDCVNLTSITLPTTLISVGSWAFYSCPLVSLVIPKAVTHIGECVFSVCSSLKSIVLPPSVTSISNGMFSGCTSLESIDLQYITSIAGCCIW